MAALNKMDMNVKEALDFWHILSNRSLLWNDMLVWDGFSSAIKSFEGDLIGV